MKKRNLLTLMLVALLAFTLGMGTLAYYTKTFASNDNLVRAARFTVDSGGTLEESVEFDLTGDPLIPGDQRDLYEFEIHKNDTEVPVKYGVKVTGIQKLFDANSPVKLNLYKKIGEDWKLYDGAEFIATEDIERFKIEAVWEHGDNDIAYQDAIGKVAINVVATQADEEPVDPQEPVDPETAKVMIEEANNALIGLDSIPSGTGVNRGNFSKENSDAVQKLIDDVREYVGLLPSGNEKTELLEGINGVQILLDDKVASRYVYYEIISEGTRMNQLALSLSAEFWTGKIMERIEGNPIINIPTKYGGVNTLKFEYNKLGNPKQGDIFSVNLRFNGGVRSIDAIITNLGDGNWEIESDWLKPSSGR